MDIISITIFLLFGVVAFSSIWKKFYHTASYELITLAYLSYLYYFEIGDRGKPIFEHPEGIAKGFFGFEALIFLLVVGAIGFVLDLFFRKLKKQFEKKFIDSGFKFSFYLIVVSINAVIMWQILMILTGQL